MLSQFFVVAFPEPVREAFLFVLKLAPIWLPIFLIVVFFRLWKQYTKAHFIASQDYVLLEIKLPREVMKSPLAMENVLSGLHQGSDGTFLEQWWDGKVRPWWSLEIASIDGQIKFYVWTRRFLQKIVENNFYAQFPDIEVVEADDYTRKVRFDLDETDIWGCDFALLQADPIPIKTYVDYKLDTNPKEEEKIDPMAHLLEFLGSVGPGEQVWLQIMIRVNKKNKKIPGKRNEYMDWKGEARQEITKIRANPEETEQTPEGVIKRLSFGQQETIKAMERSISKQGFDCGIRGVYLAKKGNFNPTMIAGLTSIFRQFSSETLNGFMPTRYLTKYDYPWQDFREMRQNKDRYRVFDAFRKRSWFHEPYKTPYFVLNTEELATIYHLPSQAIQTPTLDRIPSTRQGAPANLPL